jgi:hypothetical protein
MTLVGKYKFYKIILSSNNKLWILWKRKMNNIYKKLRKKAKTQLCKMK